MVANDVRMAWVHRNNVFSFDVLNAGFREWWVDTVAKGVAESVSDGASIDQMHGFSWLRKKRSHEVSQRSLSANHPTPERWQFTREFEHASFWGDLETKEAKIEWAKPNTE